MTTDEGGKHVTALELRGRLPKLKGKPEKQQALVALLKRLGQLDLQAVKENGMALIRAGFKPKALDDLGFATTACVWSSTVRSRRHATISRAMSTEYCPYTHGPMWLNLVMNACLSQSATSCAPRAREESAGEETRARALARVSAGSRRARDENPRQVREPAPGARTRAWRENPREAREPARGARGRARAHAPRRER